MLDGDVQGALLFLISIRTKHVLLYFLIIVSKFEG